MVHIRSEVLNYYVVSTYCVYIALIVVKLSYELTWNCGIRAQVVRGSKAVVETKQLQWQKVCKNL